MGFYPRHPRGWRLNVAEKQNLVARFYPRHPRGWRLFSLLRFSSGQEFLSTPPSRVATRCPPTPARKSRSFYPRHPRGWRPNVKIVKYFNIFVSIHATLAGGDLSWTLPMISTSCFYPRHPRGWRRVGAQTLHLPQIPCFYPRHPRGWRQGEVLNKFATIQFLSTPPSRVATSHWTDRRRTRKVSIHATLAGGDVQALQARSRS